MAIQAERMQWREVKRGAWTRMRVRRGVRRMWEGGADAACRAGVSASAPVSVQFRVPWRWGDACGQSDSILCVVIRVDELRDAGQRKVSFVVCISTSLRPADFLGAFASRRVVERKRKQSLQRVSCQRHGGVCAYSAATLAPRVCSHAVWIY